MPTGLPDDTVRARAVEVNVGLGVVGSAKNSIVILRYHTIEQKYCSPYNIIALFLYNF